MKHAPEPGHRHDRAARTGLLLVNLGPPEAPTAPALPYRTRPHPVHPGATEAELYVPGAQEVHTKGVSEATAVPYAPTPHAVHADAAACELYEPAAQGRHIWDELAAGAAL